MPINPKFIISFISDFISITKIKESIKNFKTENIKFVKTVFDIKTLSFNLENVKDILLNFGIIDFGANIKPT